MKITIGHLYPDLLDMAAVSVTHRKEGELKAYYMRKVVRKSPLSFGILAVCGGIIL